MSRKVDDYVNDIGFIEALAAAFLGRSFGADALNFFRTQWNVATNRESLPDRSGHQRRQNVLPRNMGIQTIHAMQEKL